MHATEQLLGNGVWQSVCGTASHLDVRRYRVPAKLRHLLCCTSMSQILLSTRSRLAIGLAVGAVFGLAVWWLAGTALAPALGITVGEAVFLVSSWLMLWPMNSAQTEQRVSREDLSPRVDDALVAGICALAVASMVAMQYTSAPSGVAAVLTLAGVFGAWACVHLTYAVHYAYRYYLVEDGGIDFGHENPAFRDFLYFSYAIGMTYGVTDNTVTDRHIRGIVLRHSLISFVFGLVILGAAVSLVAGAFGIG